MNTTTKCPSCFVKINVDIDPHVEAQTYGDPDSCHAAEGGTVEPENCPKCHFALDTASIYEAWADSRRGYAEYEHE